MKHIWWVKGRRSMMGRSTLFSQGMVISYYLEVPYLFCLMKTWKQKDMKTLMMGNIESYYANKIKSPFVVAEKNKIVRWVTKASWCGDIFFYSNPNNGKELDKSLLLSFPTSFHQLIGGREGSIYKVIPTYLPTYLSLQPLYIYIYKPFISL